MQSNATVSVHFIYKQTHQEKSTMELNGEFIQIELLIDCLTRMKGMNSNKEELPRFCERMHSNDWFRCRLSNRALRDRRTYLLSVFRYFIHETTIFLDKTKVNLIVEHHILPQSRCLVVIVLSLRSLLKIIFRRWSHWNLVFDDRSVTTSTEQKKESN